MSDQPYTITLEAQDSGHRVTCPLDGAAPLAEGGGGGYEEIAMNKRGSVLVWKGRGLLKLSIPIYFDGTSDQVAVAPDYTTLRHMYRPLDDTTPPPVISASVGGGTGVDVVPYLDEIQDWIVSGLQWGDAVGDGRGVRQQQMFVLELTEFRPDERLQPISAKKGKPRVRRYVIQRKDIAGGLSALARRFHLKSWRVLAESQNPPRKDPRLTEHDIGKTLIVPLGSDHGIIVISGQPQQSTRG